MLDQVMGTAKDVAGKAEDAFGGATGDFGTQVQGKMDQMAGKAQKAFGEVMTKFLDSASNNPAATLAVVAGVGFFLGVMWANRD